MLPNHNPLRVVEIFRTLEALHPGRIDLGVGRAPGTDRFTPEEQAIADEFLRGAIIGGPQRVVDGLNMLARDSGADELMLSTLVPDRKERMQSYERVSRAAGLS